MGDKKDDKPKYDAKPKDQIPTTVYQSQFSSNDKDKTTTTLQGVATPQKRDKKND